MAKQDAKNASEEVPEQRPLADLPQPPPIKRRFLIAPLQLIGVPLLALLPFLAMLGVFDEHATYAEISNNAISLRVDYASLQRYKVQEQMTAAVTLLSAESPTTVTVSFDRDYLQNFTNLSFAPDVAELLPDAYVFEFLAMESGETRLVELTLAGERPGRHIGFVSAAIAGDQPITVTVSTIVMP